MADLQKIVSLCKRRGFIFQSSEIYGGLRSAYDFGPLGAELKRNLMSEWWKSMVHSREDVVGLDASILMHPDVWHASGHVGGFSDPLVDCKVCGDRFRADKAPRKPAGTEALISFRDKHQARAAQKKLELLGVSLERDRSSLVGAVVGGCGYVCPVCGSPFLSGERPFNLMFQTTMGPVTSEGTTLYLRPETAQSMFVQFQNVLQSSGLKIPFGIAQMGKSFRNEVTTEHFIFRSCEFEQMECEYFVAPGDGPKYLEYWRNLRLSWWKDLGISSDHLRFRAHAPNELAHYSDGCWDIEYMFPWGWGELEGIASRQDFDLKAHAAASRQNMSYFDPESTDPATGQKGWRYLPHVIEPAAGATRGVLAVLCEAYDEEPGEHARTVLRLHPRLAPIKVAVLPLVKKDGMPEIARQILAKLKKASIVSKYDEQHSIGKRYARHDEIGTPFCVTVDTQSLSDETVTLRTRDDRSQLRVHTSEIVKIIQGLL